MIGSVRVGGDVVFVTASATARAARLNPAGHVPISTGPAAVWTISPGTKRLAPIRTITPLTSRNRRAATSSFRTPFGAQRTGRSSWGGPPGFRAGGVGVEGLHRHDHGIGGPAAHLPVSTTAGKRST